MTTRTDSSVLEVRDLSVTFDAGGSAVHAVRGVSYALRRGEVLGIVGESGSGKSASSLAIMRLLPASARVQGSIRLNGTELVGLGDRELSRLRGNSVSMIFQDPLSALTPVYTIGDQIAEALLVHDDELTKEAAAARAVELLQAVGIAEADHRAKAYPHEFSGGMRQRVMIAMAMANDPDVIVADEPTTALDVTIQAQVLDALRSARELTGAALVLITHDLSVVAGVADDVAVMYAGRIVETGTVDEVFYGPRMPYTIGLLGAIPRIDDAGRRPLVPIEGSPPSLANMAPGCPFAPRCPLALQICREVEPELLAVAATGHRAACHRSDEISELGLSAQPEPADPRGESQPPITAQRRSAAFEGVHPAGAPPIDPGPRRQHGFIHDYRRVQAQRVFPVPAIPAAPAESKPRAERAAVLEVDALVRHFPLLKGAIFKRRIGTVQAVDGISFDIREGETLGLVGESGCGKTTTLLQVLELTAAERGRVVVLGHDTGELDSASRRALRREISVVFQDPLASLDPRMPVSDIIAEPLRTHGRSRLDVARRVRELLPLVGLEPAHASRYPQQFSGGQRQRIAIARALALEPRLLLLDEPVSALDVSIQAGVVNLLEELRVRLGLSYLFVAHDLSVVRQIADRVAVMYLGRIVEIGELEAVYAAPAHPYTQALLSAIPIPDPRKERRRKRIVLSGDLPSAANPPSGCRFRTRCQKFAALDEQRRQACIDVDPALERVSDDHAAACHYAERLRVV
jgi:peptide/nickel transport system ATP-binding protein